jgi:hypothetical protein
MAHFLPFYETVKQEFKNYFNLFLGACFADFKYNLAGGVII